MASIPFTLAALATSAVPGLAVFGVREHQEDAGFAEAVIMSDDAELLVRVPRTQAAEVQQSATILGLAALTEGPRGRLPFQVPEVLGMTRAGETRAVVSTFIDGEQFAAEDLRDDALLLQPIAEAIAAIHDLPLGVAQSGGLPVLSAQDLRLVATRLIDRAEATRLVPETVLQRWQQAVEAAELWDFAPTTVHGSLEASRFRVIDDHIAGVLGWSELSVGDPASDLAWLFAPGSEVLDAVLARYAGQRNAGSMSHLRTRAALYHELEVAKWLLHGTEIHDPSIVDDAVAMMDRMVGVNSALSVAYALSQSRSPLGESEVTALLEDTPAVTSYLSDTAAVEALDEDRMFDTDHDFRDTGVVTADRAPAEQAADDRADGAHTDEDLAETGVVVDAERPADPAAVERAAVAGASSIEPVTAAELAEFAALSADTGVVPDFDFTDPQAGLPATKAPRPALAEPAVDADDADNADDQLTQPYSDDELPGAGAPRDS